MHLHRSTLKDSDSPLSRHFLRVMVNLFVIRILRLRSARTASEIYRRFKALKFCRLLDRDSGLHVADDTEPQVRRRHWQLMLMSRWMMRPLWWQQRAVGRPRSEAQRAPGRARQRAAPRSLRRTRTPRPARLPATMPVPQPVASPRPPGAQWHGRPGPGACRPELYWHFTTYRRSNLKFKFQEAVCVESEAQLKKGICRGHETRRPPRVLLHVARFRPRFGWLSASWLSASLNFTGSLHTTQMRKLS
jgi:hypothetical protein